jgi:predicted nucleic acid-binding protein
MRIVLSDTSPLRYLILIGEDRLLKEIYEQILLPEEVAKELQAARTPEAVRDWMENPPSWLVIVPPPRFNPEASVSTLIDAGERQVILSAFELQPDLILMDDRAGVQEARRLGFTVTGTLGILARGAELGLIDLKTALDQLQQTNFRINPKLLAAMLSLDVQSGKS